MFLLLSNYSIIRLSMNFQIPNKDINLLWKIWYYAIKIKENRYSLYLSPHKPLLYIINQIMTNVGEFVCYPW